MITNSIVIYMRKKISYFHIISNGKSNVITAFIKKWKISTFLGRSSCTSLIVAFSSIMDKDDNDSSKRY